MRKFSVGVLGGLVAMLCFAGSAHASATIDLIWSGGGTVITPASSSTTITLNVVLTAGPGDISSYSFDVDYSGVTVASFTNVPNGVAPFAFALTR